MSGPIPISQWNHPDIEPSSDGAGNVSHARTPDGYRKILCEAYTNGQRVVVLGLALPGHSCDAMGCGSAGLHVIGAFNLDKEGDDS